MEMSLTGSNPNTVGGAYNLKNILSSSENTIGCILIVIIQQQQQIIRNM